MKPHRQTARQGNHWGLSAIPRGAQWIERSRGDKQNPKPTFDRLPKSKKVDHFKVTKGLDAIMQKDIQWTTNDYYYHSTWTILA